MKPKIILLSALLAVAVILVWRMVRTPERALRGRALDRREIALRALGEHLATQAAGQTALVLANPFSQMPGQAREVYAFEDAALRGLKEGWGERIQLAGVAYPELLPAAKQDPSSIPIPPDATTPLSFLTAERAWDRLAEQHPNAGIFVSVIGLPAGVETLDCWRKPKPRMALLLPDLRLVGDSEAIAAAFTSGKILAAVLNRPGAPSEAAAVARDFRAEFEARFLLVTATNVHDLVQIFPNLF